MHCQPAHQLSVALICWHQTWKRQVYRIPAIYSFAVFFLLFSWTVGYFGSSSHRGCKHWHRLWHERPSRALAYFAGALRNLRSEHLRLPSSEQLAADREKQAGENKNRKVSCSAPWVKSENLIRRGQKSRNVYCGSFWAPDSTYSITYEWKRVKHIQEVWYTETLAIILSAKNTL